MQSVLAKSTPFSFGEKFGRPTTITLDDDIAEVLKRSLPDIRAYLEMTLETIAQSNPYASAPMVDELVKREAHKKADAERLMQLYRSGLSAND